MQMRMMLKYREFLERMYQRYVPELEACLAWSSHLAIEFRKKHPNE